MPIRWYRSTVPLPPTSRSKSELLRGLGSIPGIGALLLGIAVIAFMLAIAISGVALILISHTLATGGVATGLAGLSIAVFMAAVFFKIGLWLLTARANLAAQSSGRTSQ